MTGTPEQAITLAAHYRSCGARFLVVGVDTLILRQAALKLAACFRDMVASSKQEIPC